MSNIKLHNEGLMKKWGKVLESQDAPQIKNKSVANTVAQLCENTIRNSKVERTLMEATPTSVSGNAAKFDPILVSMIRRVVPQLAAHDLVGVQPMSASTGLVYAKRALYTNTSGAEAFVNAPNTTFTGKGTGSGGAAAASDTATDPFGTYTTGLGQTTAEGEGDTTKELTFIIEKSTVEAATRKLKATYSIELAQDLAASHGLDANAELMMDCENLLAQEINQQLLRTLQVTAKLGAADTAVAGTFDLDADTDGRHLAEKVQTLLLQIDFESNIIQREALRGRANKLICTPNVAAVLARIGLLDWQSKLTDVTGQNFSVDYMNTIRVGQLGMYEVFVDPWSTVDYFLVGYKGDDTDAGMFYCPYVPFQMTQAVDPASGQPILFFKTRYGMISNPFVRKSDGTQDGASFTARRNQYYRIAKVDKIRGI